MTHFTKYRLRTLAQDAFTSWLWRLNDKELLELLRGNQPMRRHRRMDLSSAIRGEEIERILREDKTLAKALGEPLATEETKP